MANDYLHGMAKRKRSKKTQEELNIENQFLKLKMMAEFGENFVVTDNLPANFENHLLRRVLYFHQNYKSSRKITVYQFIGEPPYNHVHDMNGREIKRELKKLLRLMAQKGVNFEVLAPTPDRDIYRFVTEELFKEKIDEVRMKGWTNDFIYEDYHPNLEYDVKNAVYYVLSALFDAQFPFFDDYFAEEMQDALGLTTDIEEITEKVQDFRKDYNDVILVDYDFIKLKIYKSAGQARVLCDVTYKTQKVRGRRTARHVQTVELFLKQHNRTNSLWQVTRIISDIF